MVDNNSYPQAALCLHVGNTPYYVIDRIYKINILKEFIANNWSYSDNGVKEIPPTLGIDLFLLSFSMSVVHNRRFRKLIQQIAKAIYKKDLSLLRDMSSSDKMDVITLLQSAIEDYSPYFTPLIEQYSLRDIMGFDYQRKFKKLMANKKHKNNSEILILESKDASFIEKHALFSIKMTLDEKLVGYPTICNMTGYILYSNKQTWLPWIIIENIIAKLPEIEIQS